MRIVILNPSYPPVACGVGDYTRGLARALAAAGNDVTVVTEAGATAAAPGPPRVYPLFADWNVLSFARAWSRLRRLRAQLVVTNFPAKVRGEHARLLYVLPLLAKSTLGRPRVTFIVHEFVRVDPSGQRVIGIGLRAADRIVAVTEAEQRAIAARFPRLAPRVVVAENPPTVTPASADAQADARMRARLETGARPLIGFIGLLNRRAKGFEELLQALARTDATLVATGSLDPADAYQAHLAAIIEQLGVGDRVRWLGRVSDEEAGRMLRVVDAVVLPYHGGAEPGYTSLLAALVNGAAVITTRGTLNPPWLREGENALLVHERDVDALVTAIARVHDNRALAETLRAGAAALAFSWDELVAAVAGAPDRAAAALQAAPMKWTSGSGTMN